MNKGTGDRPFRFTILNYLLYLVLPTKGVMMLKSQLNMIEADLRAIVSFYGHLDSKMANKLVNVIEAVKEEKKMRDELSNVLCEVVNKL